jgi:hypothetical protein
MAFTGQTSYANVLTKEMWGGDADFIVHMCNKKNLN